MLSSSVCCDMLWCVFACVCVWGGVCVCNEAKEKSFVMPSDSVALSTRQKLPEHNREGLG